MAASKLEQAEQCLQQALGLDPRSADAWYALGSLAERAGDLEAARACYEELVRLHPGHAQGHFSLGNVHAISYDFNSARSAYARALELDPGHQGAWGNLGNVEKYFGRFQEAIRCYRKAIELEQDPAQQVRRHSNLLISLHYDESLSHQALREAHAEWAQRYAQHLYPSQAAWTNAPDAGRMLRIGYVSGNLASNIMEHFLRNVLAHHDPAKFRVYLYSSSSAQGDSLEKMRRACQEWIDIRSMDDAAAAERIRADAIDILVDLDGHSPTGRPLIFARKPAPVQVIWLDYFNTSGMDTIDYILTDPYTTPEQSVQLFTEIPERLPHSRFCYAPADYAPAVAGMSCLSGAPFTFGSFNRQDKLHPQLLDTWAEILLAVPDSRLLLKNRALQVGALRQILTDEFARKGIAEDRLLLRGPSSHAQMLSEYGDVDVALDTFPYNGGLTTCECLWMGVPIVALEAERMIGRQTAAFLRLLGMDDWVARSREDYVRLAIEKSRQRERVSQVRIELRQVMASSPLCDAPRFARDLESSYRSIWQRYCEQASPTKLVPSLDQ